MEGYNSQFFSSFRDYDKKDFEPDLYNI